MNNRFLVPFSLLALTVLLTASKFNSGENAVRRPVENIWPSDMPSSVHPQL